MQLRRSPMMPHLNISHRIIIVMIIMGIESVSASEDVTGDLKQQFCLTAVAFEENKPALAPNAIRAGDATAFTAQFQSHLLQGWPCFLTVECIAHGATKLHKHSIRNFVGLVLCILLYGKHTYTVNIRASRTYTVSIHMR